MFRPKLFIGILLLSIAVWTGVDMYLRFSDDSLWGDHPLVLFASLWLALIILFEKRVFPRRKFLLLSSMSGVLLAIGFPPSPTAFVMFGAFVPLLFLLNEWDELKRQGESLRVLQYVFNTFLIWNIFSTYWVTNTAFGAGIFAIVVNSMLMCIPVWLYMQAKRFTSPLIGVMAFAAFWISFEYFHMRWELTWPWLTLGNSWSVFPKAIQWYEFTGHLGGSLWILVMNYLIYKSISLCFFKKKIKPATAHIIGGILLAGVPMIWSLFIYNNYEEKVDPVNVVVVQPNFEPHYQKFIIPDSEQLKTFLSLTEEHINSETNYVVFPETSFGVYDHDQLYNYATIRHLKSLMDNYPGTNLVTGLSSFFIYPKAAVPDKRWVRERISDRGDTTHLAVANSAIQFTGGLEEYEVYLKSKLVPGAEIFPYRKVFFFMEPLVKQLGGSLHGWAIQDLRESFQSDVASIAPSICYESVYGEYMTGYIKQGADLIFIITNDGWWDNTPGHKQHMHFARLRAIETRRSIARSANTGISCFINQRGDILQPTEYGVSTSINGVINKNTEITAYVRYGDIIGRIALFLALIIALVSVAGYFKRRAGIEGEGE